MRGQKTGGRTKGTPNKVTTETAVEIAKSGLTPLDYMLGLLRNEEAELAVRFEAAKAAAPYVHPRLAALTAQVEGSFTMPQELAEWLDKRS